MQSISYSEEMSFGSVCLVLQDDRLLCCNVELSPKGKRHNRAG